MSEHQTYRDPYLLLLTHAYNVQVQKSIKVYFFSLTLTRTPRGPATIAPRRANLATDDDMASLMYTRLELIKRVTALRQEAEKTLRLAQRRCRKGYARRVRFAHIFRIGD